MKRNVRILQLIEGAGAATGTAVIIDAFRAFSLEAYLFAGGAKEIYPIGDVKIAYGMKEKNPDAILAGERGGKILEGFDLGNTPSDAVKMDVQNKTVIHTTSAGTQGVANAVFADEILGASLVNARATAEYLLKTGKQDISLVCMGLAGREETEEDTLCARYIKAILEGEEATLDMPTELDSLRYTSGAKFFDPSQSDAFPTEDFFLCTALDRFDFVMRYDRNTGKMQKLTL